jgi:hypothetical protein
VQASAFSEETAPKVATTAAGRKNLERIFIFMDLFSRDKDVRRDFRHHATAKLGNFDSVAKYLHFEIELFTKI